MKYHLRRWRGGHTVQENGYNADDQQERLEYIWETRYVLEGLGFNLNLQDISIEIPYARQAQQSPRVEGIEATNQNWPQFEGVIQSWDSSYQGRQLMFPDIEYPLKALHIVIPNWNDGILMRIFLE